MSHPSRPQQPNRKWRAVVPLFLLAEVLVVVGLFQLIGWWTIVVLLAMSALGLFVITRSSRRAWRDIRTMRRTGVAPERTAGDAGFTLASGVLLMIPGVLSGLLGLLLLVPFTRVAVRRTVGVVATRKVLGAMGVRVYDGAGTQLFGDVVPGERAEQPRPTYEQVPRQAIEGKIVDGGGNR